MNIHVNKSGSFGVKDQIKRQIRLLIESGELAPGQAMPSVRDMAGLINVNRNTVSAAYREMAEQGWLTIVTGSGAYVAENRAALNNKILKSIFDRAVREAIDQGYGVSRIADYFVTRLDVNASMFRERGLAVVDCNHEVIKAIREVIATGLGVESEGVLIQDLEAGNKEAVRIVENADLVACGFSHIEEIKKVLPGVGPKLVATLLKPDIRLMNELLRAPAGTRIACVCVHQRSAGSFYRNLPFSQGSSLVKIWVGMDNPGQVKRTVDQCDMVFATEYVYDAVRKITPPDKKVVRIALEVDPAIIEVIRERMLLLEAR